jgi:hypothetical protein
MFKKLFTTKTQLERLKAKRDRHLGMFKKAAKRLRELQAEYRRACQEAFVLAEALEFQARAKRNHAAVLAAESDQTAKHADKVEAIFKV